jgi:cob(I)alamin adenosyltransferase
MSKRSLKGLVHIYTGNGKGKTTAALGLAMRASGRGMKVIVIQFLKGITSGEHLFLKDHAAFEIKQISSGDIFAKRMEQLTEESQQTLTIANNEIQSGKYDLVILDEILIALSLDAITLEQVEELINKKPDKLELVLTGRDAPEELIERADLVTEMRMVKHPFTKGIPARKGIEF